MKIYVKQINEPAESLRKCLLGFTVQGTDVNTASRILNTRAEAVSEMENRLQSGDTRATENEIRISELGC